MPGELPHRLRRVREECGFGVQQPLVPVEGTPATGRSRRALTAPGGSGALSGVPNTRWGPTPGEDPTENRLAEEVQVVDVEELDDEGAGCGPPPWPTRPGPVVMVFRSLLTSSITGDPDFVPNTS